MQGSGLTCVARVYGGGALALVLAQLRGADIWATVDLPHGTTLLSDRAVALGGTRVLVLDHDAPEAEAFLANSPPIVSSGLRGWLRIVFVIFLFQCGAPCSPFAVFLQRTARPQVSAQV